MPLGDRRPNLIFRHFAAPEVPPGKEAGTL
jgi:hypothetical protein